MVKSRKTKRKNKVHTTPKQAAALKYILSHPGASMAEAMRHAGYSENSIKNPHLIRQSSGYSAILDKAGISDNALAKEQARLLNSSRLEEKTFWALGVGKKKKKRYRHTSDEMIKICIEGTEDQPTGCVLLGITTARDHKVAIYRHPDNASRGRALELALKTKGHLSPSPYDLPEHALDDHDREVLSSIFSANKK